MSADVLTVQVRSPEIRVPGNLKDHILSICALLMEKRGTSLSIPPEINDHLHDIQFQVVLDAQPCQLLYATLWSGTTLWRHHMQSTRKACKMQWENIQTNDIHSHISHIDGTVHLPLLTGCNRPWAVA